MSRSELQPKVIHNMPRAPRSGVPGRRGLTSACLLSAAALAAWVGVAMHRAGRAGAAVLVQTDAAESRQGELPVAEAVPIKVRALKAGERLPRGAVVIKPDGGAGAARASRAAGARASAGASAETGGAAQGQAKGARRKATAQSKQQQLMFARTTESARWPSEKNPLKDFDADFLGEYDVKGFPATTATADWPFTRNPLLGFDEGFKNKWKGWKGPEHNVYAELPAHYPFMETKLAPSQEGQYKAWANVGGEPEHNVFDIKNGMVWPNY